MTTREIISNFRGNILEYLWDSKLPTLIRATEFSFLILVCDISALLTMITYFAASSECFIYCTGDSKSVTILYD